MVEFKHLESLYQKKNEAYGDAYNKFGDVMEKIFPNGLKVESRSDWIRLGLYIQFVEKILRIGNLTFNSTKDNFESKQDSCDDLSVLSQMMKGTYSEKSR